MESSTAKDNLLEQLASKYQTDKRAGIHNYTHYYGQYLGQKRHEILKLVEIGVKDGSSLRMWADFFPTAHIYGIDIQESCRQYENNRISIHIGPQEEIGFLNQFVHETGASFDVVIDDGAHGMDHQINSFLALFPSVRSGGLYVIEDLHTSYWPEYGGALGKSGTTIDFMKALIDSINLYGKSGYGDIQRALAEVAHDPELNYYDRHILGLHVYKSICFILKR